jgi:CubicO group peptidase (beta-lactamase class C family)
MSAVSDASWISQTLSPFCEDQIIAGAVGLVATKERTVAVGAAGLADISAKIPMREDSLFWIASTTKPITATAFMMLVEQGLIDLDAPVERYLPEFADQMVVAEKTDDHTVIVKNTSPITVRQVLTHTAGVPFLSRIEKVIDGRPLRECVVSVAMTPLAFPPGTKYEYANGGTNTAGRILEVVSGQPYEQFVQQRIFDPLGMSDTTFFPSETQVNRLAKSYAPGPDGVGLVETPIHFMLQPLSRKDRYATPGGGLFSTAADLAKFGRMILSGGELNGRRYLGQDALREMTTCQTDHLAHLNAPKYGLHWGIVAEEAPLPTAPQRGCGHGGAYSNDFLVDPHKGIVRILMMQQKNFAPGVNNPAHAAFVKAINEKWGS